ncbi:hypothetical protein BC833DRAFT_585007 [Globomyces pollinis-pini]|nr:hypothetical protein BC833DRAFT_585007 [Globomyces pollinis-pini]
MTFLTFTPSIPTILDYTDSDHILIETNKIAILRSKLERIFELKNIPDKNVTIPAMDTIKEFIYYAREEIQLCYDITQRLVNSLNTTDLPSSDQPHLRTSIIQKKSIPPPNVSLQILKYIEAMKKNDLKESVMYLKKHSNQLQNLLEREQRFYGGLALELLSRSWILQERNWNNIHRILYVNYGFRHDGSNFKDFGEADIWRQSISIEEPINDMMQIPNGSRELEIIGNEVEVISSHKKQYFTSISISNCNSNIPWGFPLSQVTSKSKIITVLSNSRTCIFEKELFNQIQKEITDNSFLKMNCSLSKTSMSLPLGGPNQMILSCSLKDQHPENKCETMEMDHHSSIIPDYNFETNFLEMKSRLLLLKSFQQNRNQFIDRRAKTPVNIAVTLISFIQQYEIYKQIQSTFDDISQLNFVLESNIKTTYLNGCNWKWEFSIHKHKYTCTLIDGIITSFTLKQPNNIQLSFIIELKRGLLYLIMESLMDTVYEECFCLFEPNQLNRINYHTMQLKHQQR